MKPVRNWMESHGKIAYAPTGKLKTELHRYEEMRKQFDVYRENGKVNDHRLKAVA